MGSLNTMLGSLTLARTGGNNDITGLLIILFAGAAGLVVLVAMAWVATRYRRCPSNRILVVYGRVGSGRASKCIHGGGAFVWPLIQD